MSLRLAVVALALLGCSGAFGGQVSFATVTRDATRFHIDFEVQVVAPVDKMKQLVGDLRNLAQLSPSTREARLLSPGEAPNTESVPWAWVILRPCVLVFCKTLKKVSRVSEGASGQTRYEAIASLSSFRSASEELVLTGNATHTRLRYRAMLEPDFFVPPVIGPWLVRRVIVREMLTAAERAEAQLKLRPGAASAAQ